MGVDRKPFFSGDATARMGQGSMTIFLSTISIFVPQLFLEGNRES
jgi:hypothetical protein